MGWRFRSGWAGLALCLAVGTAQAALFGRTVDNLLTEVEAARAEGKQLAVVLTLPDCPGCLEMERTVYPDKAAERRIGRRFRTVRLDLSQTGSITDAGGRTTTPAELAKRLRAVATPSFVFFAGDGAFLYRYTGTLDRSGLRDLADYVAQARFENVPFIARNNVGPGATSSHAGGPALHAALPAGTLPHYPEFSLAATDGRERHPADFRGKVVALAVGYTQCPDVCPTTLVELKAAVEALLPRQRQDVQILFATLDPERDNLALLKEYAASFSPAGGRPLLGLRGDAGQTARLISQLQLIAEKQPSASMGYTLDHTAGVFLFDATGRLRGVSPYDQPVDLLSRDLAQLLGDDTQRIRGHQRLSQTN